MWSPSPFVPLPGSSRAVATVCRTSPRNDPTPHVYTGRFGPVQLVVVWCEDATRATWCHAETGARLGAAHVGVA